MDRHRQTAKMAEPVAQVPITPEVAARTGAGSRVRRMLLAAGRLSEPSRTLFDRLFLVGEKETAVRNSMGLTEQEFDRQHENMLRALMSATQ